MWSRVIEESTKPIHHSSTGLNSRNHGDEWKRHDHPFFYESSSGELTPRSVFVDAEVDDTRLKFYRSGICLDPESTIRLPQDCRSNFFAGVHMARCGIMESVEESIRLQLERCDAFSGFLSFQSFGGGTGSGLGVEVLRTLKECYPKQIVIQPLVWPSRDSSTSIVEPYNSIFGLTRAHTHTSLSLMIDNQATFRICHEKRGIKNPSFSHMNELIADMISMVTSSIRGRTTLNASLNEIVTNLVPEPQFHYPIVSYAPVTTPGASTAGELVKSLFRPSHTFCDIPKVSDSRFFAASILTRGNQPISIPEIQKSLSCMRPNLKSVSASPELFFPKFVPWIPNSFKVGVVEQPNITLQREGALVANCTAVSGLFSREYKKFLHLFFHKAFVWQYLEAGGEMDDFYEAREKVSAMISAYDNVTRECLNAESQTLQTEFTNLTS